MYISEEYIKSPLLPEIKFFSFARRSEVFTQIQPASIFENFILPFSYTVD